MARKPRLEWEGASYHVMARGNERARIFKSREDYILFIKTLQESLDRFGAEIHAWCLMPNHYHLAATTPRGNLSRWMAWLQTTFTTRYNRRYKRVGHLFQGRYRAEVVDSDAYAVTLVNYIHLNPVRKKAGGILQYTGGLKELAAFPWSGHVDMLGLRKEPLLPLYQGWRHYWGRSPSGFIEGYRKSLQRALKVSPEPWGHVVDRLRRQANPDAMSWRKPREQSGLRERVEKQLKSESNKAVIAWVRTRVLGEKGVEVGRALGHRDGSGVTQAAKRLEMRSQTDPKLKNLLESYRNLSNVKN